MEHIAVSVVMITYGQEKYIKQAIESILMQQTDFAIELIIGDDHPLDTAEKIVADIIKNDTKGHLIKYTRHTINKGIVENMAWTMKQAKGDYIAICEGDDYWTDPLKLQKQVDFMKKHGDCSLCFHAWENLNDNTGQKILKKPRNIPQDNKFTTKNIILGGGGFMATNSMFFRSIFIKELPSWLSNSAVADLPLMLLLSVKGKVGYIDDYMSTYRLFSTGSWSQENYSDFKKRKKHDQNTKLMWDNFDNWTDKKFHNVINKKKYINRKAKLKEKVLRLAHLVLNKKPY